MRLPFRWEVFALALPAGVHRRLQPAGYERPLSYRRGFGVHALGVLLIVCRRPADDLGIDWAGLSWRRLRGFFVRGSQCLARCDSMHRFGSRWCLA